jgi:hypothetical protein
MADVGEMYRQAFTDLGRGINDGLTKAIQEYKQRQDAIQRSDMAIDYFHQQVNPGTGKPFIADKDWQEYHHHSDKQRAVLGGIMIGGMKVLGQAQKSAQDVVTSQTKKQLMEARTRNVDTRTDQTKIAIRQALGLIPKPQQPPTAGQIMLHQRSQYRAMVDQQKAAQTQRDKIETMFSKNHQIEDPSTLLNQQDWQYGTKKDVKNFIGNVTEPNKFLPTGPDQPAADYVKVPGLPKPIPTDQAFSLQKKAIQWQQLGDVASTKPTMPPPITAPPDKMQMLLTNPTPQNKAYFDQVYGQGAADTVIGAQGIKDPNTQPAPAATPEQPEDTSSEEEPPTEPPDTGE